MDNIDRIAKYQNNTKVFEFNDDMIIAPLENAAELHSKMSRIKIVGIDTSKGSKEKAVVVTCKVEPVVIKVLCEKVLKLEMIHNKKEIAVESSSSGSSEVNENKMAFGKYKGFTPTGALMKDGEAAIKDLEYTSNLLSQKLTQFPNNQKYINEINAAIKRFKAGGIEVNSSPETNTNNDNLMNTTLLQFQKINAKERLKRKINGVDKYPTQHMLIEYNPKMDKPFTVKMETGWAEAQFFPTGGTAMKAGTYTVEHKIDKIVMDEDTFKEILIQTRDYILIKETEFKNDLKDAVKEYKSFKFQIDGGDESIMYGHIVIQGNEAAKVTITDFNTRDPKVNTEWIINFQQRFNDDAIVTLKKRNIPFRTNDIAVRFFTILLAKQAVAKKNM